MATPVSTSVIGNAVSNRQRLSGIRQRIGLEFSRGTAPQSSIRPIAPSPASGPANKPGAAMQAMSAPMVVEGSGGDPNRDMGTPVKVGGTPPGVVSTQSPGLRPATPSPSRMSGLAQDFMRNYRPPLRVRSGGPVAFDRMPRPVEAGGQRPGPPADVYGRLPARAQEALARRPAFGTQPRQPQGQQRPRPGARNPMEIVQMARGFLAERLGRAPTELELKLYMARPPK